MRSGPTDLYTNESRWFRTRAEQKPPGLAGRGRGDRRQRPGRGHLHRAPKDRCCGISRAASLPTRLSGSWPPATPSCSGSPAWRSARFRKRRT
jgi:hypothetical protein